MFPNRAFLKGRKVDGLALLATSPGSGLTCVMYGDLNIHGYVDLFKFSDSPRSPTHEDVRVWSCIVM